VKKIHFIFGVHCHQPVGNFDSVFEKAFLNAYEPFWEVLKRHPGIKVSAHFSGCLLDWLKSNRPEFLSTLQGLVRKGQVEMMSGGYYEPILPLLTRDDALGQIRLMNGFCKRFSGVSPRGLWLAERVWEPHLASLISEAGISYTVVDDSHFELVGFKPEELDGYYATEEAGERLYIFPGSERLRYLIPFKMPEETLNYLRKRMENGQNCAVLSDDGEKFGSWPETYEWVYEKNWLEKFFTLLEENIDWIEFTHFSEYLKKFPASGRVYLPCASYREMMEWSGGFFRNFLVRYPEANHMHKRMLRVSNILRESSEKKDEAGNVLNKARQELYKAQCNCAYWHGIFGGLYLHHLRQAVYEHLIKAEEILRRNKKCKLEAVEEDIDRDGDKEIAVSTPYLNLYVDPRERGMITEIDYIPESVNITNTLTRRYEVYHKRLVQPPSSGVASIHEKHRVKEEGLDRYINYDSYRKACLLDHFLTGEAGINDFICGKLNLPEVSYKPRLIKNARSINLILSRNGGEPRVEMDKIIRVGLDSPDINVIYRFRNLSAGEIRFRFGTEFNFSLYSSSVHEPKEAPENTEWALEDDWFGITVRFAFTRPVGLWHFPLMTVSGSEGGLEKTYQGVSLLFHRYITVPPGREDKLELNLKFNRRSPDAR
jgi:alpha-amylase